ncbi:flagellar biosynthesis chaperone FliJ [Lederbergia sp. NSJ-179]|uniref:flagellar export protein FliJ n=1 Tax=Lederbergia sp. NSJ-179 TaxID=2931402 RepID=UPI001FD0D0D5|nr:flagellar export protein FliJ [Lederbergia sp. NSJ-179]MCJ7839641.1 flagellar biosynthesis chaperone FliJ [Lederbergia sp. NSJ-179]
MSYQYKFQKILMLKEKEKEESLNTYQESVKKFTTAAEHLYDLLKKKEDLEKFQSQELSGGLSVDKIRHYQHFIANLEKSIKHAQGLVIHARNVMNWHEEKLKESNIEVKKYEKLKEKSYQAYLEVVNKTENLNLDEFSSRQYFYRGGN